MLGGRLALAASAASNRRLLRMLAAYLLHCLSEFGSWMVILLVAFDRGGAVLVGAASVAMLVPAIAVTPFVAAFGDRMPRGRALSRAQASVGVLAGLLAALLALEAPLWLLLAVGALQTIAAGLVRPLHYAALPFVAVHPAELVAANGVSMFVEGASLFFGFAGAGAVLGTAEPYQAMIGCAVLEIAAVILTSRLRVAATRQHLTGASPSAFASAVNGLSSLRGNWGVLALLMMLAGISVVDGANEPLLLNFNAEVLGLTDSTAGLLAGAYGAGLALGGAFHAGLAGRRAAPFILWGAVVLAAAFAAVGAATALPTAFLLAGAAGAGASVVVIAARTLLQRGTDNAVLARVFAAQEAVRLAGLSLGALLAPLLITALGPRLAFLPIALILPAVAVLARRRLSILDGSAGVRVREVQLLRRVPYLAALDAHALEHLAQSATWLDVDPGTRVVQQGDIGEAFFLVESGELSVAVDGQLRDHTLGPGDGFGEIALLLRVPRSATITAITPCELLRLDAPHFLSAVTASTDGARLADEVAQERLAGDGGH